MTALALVMVSSAAWAGEVPLYEPAPAWVKPAPPIDAAPAAADAPAFLLFDAQQRIDGAKVTSYVDSAQRAVTAQALDQMGTLSFTWLPDKGDLIVHRLEIVRGAEHVDLLKSGARPTVLRREQGLEQRALDGQLTATMPVEGLRVGDVLRVTFSTTQADAALNGRAQAYAPLLAEPLRLGFGRVRLVWPAKQDVHVNALVDGVALKPVTIGADREIVVPLPIAKLEEVPNDAPQRFRPVPLIEATTFTGWPDVSKTIAPLFATEGLIAEGSPLAVEVDTIVKTQPDALRRAEAALELVQSKVRYLAVGMDGGNYVPQQPAATWSLRYGDCKAKTLLLLAMLHRMGVEAEPVLANGDMGGLLPKRLPAAGAFNHVLVRATIEGKTYWLDGTGGGARLADIGDTPGFRYVLPVRDAGADLMPLPIHANARPDATVALDLDDSAGIRLPTLYRATITIRGQTAEALAAAASQVNEEQKRELISGIVQRFFAEGQLGDAALAYDPSTGIGTVTASGLVTTRWDLEDRRRRYTLDAAISKRDFSPDRARAGWQAIPVAFDGPGTIVYRTTLKLPDAGRGYVLEGDRTLPASLAGARMTRSASLDGGIARTEDRVDEVGGEIAPADLPAARADYARAQSRLLKVVAPTDLPARWQLVLAARKGGRFKPLEAMYAKAIAADPKDETGYDSRANFHEGVYDWAAALEDRTKLIDLAPSADVFAARARLYNLLDKPDKAMTDLRSAVALDSSSEVAVRGLADLKVKAGDAPGGLALVQEKIDAGGKNKTWWMSLKADLQAEAGDVPGSLVTIDSALNERPNTPTLLNSRCWLKGSRNVALESALKDCTKAIELADNPSGYFDSRAMVFYRLGRFDEALTDLDAALAIDPNIAESLYLRSAVRTKQGRGADAATDLAAARLIAPNVERDYKGYGFTF